MSLAGDITRWAGQMQLVGPTAVPVSMGTTVPLVAANPMRWALVIAVPSTSGYLIGPSPRTGAQLGFPLSSNNPPFILNFRDHGILATSGWWVFTSAGGLPVTVVEVLGVPSGE